MQDFDKIIVGMVLVLFIGIGIGLNSHAEEPNVLPPILVEGEASPSATCDAEKSIVTIHADGYRTPGGRMGPVGKPVEIHVSQILWVGQTDAIPAGGGDTIRTTLIGMKDKATFIITGWGFRQTILECTESMAI